MRNASLARNRLGKYSSYWKAKITSAFATALLIKQRFIIKLLFYLHIPLCKVVDSAIVKRFLGLSTLFLPRACASPVARSRKSSSAAWATLLQILFLGASSDRPVDRRQKPDSPLTVDFPQIVLNCNANDDETTCRLRGTIYLIMETYQNGLPAHRRRCDAPH